MYTLYTECQNEQLANEQKQHHANMSYTMKVLDKLLTKSNASKMVCTFDLNVFQRPTLKHRYRSTRDNYGRTTLRFTSVFQTNHIVLCGM